LAVRRFEEKKAASAADMGGGVLKNHISSSGMSA
jgi:hypothetical protein